MKIQLLMCAQTNQLVFPANITKTKT